MAVPSEVRIPIENERMMKLYQPALGESLDAILEGEKILLQGFAHVGNSVSYYLLTHRGLYYCESERAGFLKKRYASRFLDLGPAAGADLEFPGHLPHYAYLRFRDERGKVMISVWFQDELSRSSAHEEAQRMADVFGT